MALTPISLTSLGYIDVFQTVSRLMTDRNFQAPALNAMSSSYTTRISMYGQLQSALATFQTAAESLTGNAFDVYSATTSTEGVVSAATTSASAAGSYTVQVDQLANAQALLSAGQASETAAIGSGASTTLTFEFGTTVGTTFMANGGQTPQTVTIDASNNSLQGIASAINDAELGATAGVSFDGTNYHLTISADSTGAANSMNIGVSGDAALVALASYSPGGAQTMTETAAAQDAKAMVDGVSSSTPTNTLVGAIDGTTLTLTATGSTHVTVARDTASVAGKAADFVKAYNSLLSTFDALALANPSVNVSIMTLRSQFSRTLNATQSALTGSLYSSPAQIGFSTQDDGTLALDTAAFESALDSYAGNVAKIFTNDGKGIADAFATQTESLLEDGGWISQALSGLRSNEALVDDRKSALAFSLTGQTQALVNQYAATNLAVAHSLQAGAVLAAHFPAAGDRVNLYG